VEAHTQRVRALLLAFLLLASGHHAMAQGAAGTAGGQEPRFLVDVPTAGMLGKGTFALDVDFYQEGGVLFGISAGVLDRLSFGISYGGSRLIGAQSPVMNEIPGINVRIRVVEESMVFPAIAIGFDSQGKDGYIKEQDRYLIKSPGFYAVASKNYLLLGFFSIHGGVNYSLERGDDDRGVNFFFGAEKTIGPILSLVAEYNLGLNDNSGNAIGKGRGYVNTGLKVSLGNGLTLGVCLKDIIKNGRDITVANRTARLEYARTF
jgi:hypothetical protein